MKHNIRIEEAAMFGLSVYFFSQTDFAWWWYPALLLLPDVGMAGYIFGPKSGALTYNLFHHKGIALIFLCVGWYSVQEYVELTGIILFGHASMDRIMGYGLKYGDSFHHTHLGWINSPGEKPKADQALMGDG